MGLIRTALVAGICISLVPADQKDREVLYQRAEAVVQWTSTFCERNPRTCANASVIWAAFLDKAAFAASSGYDIAMRQLSQTTDEESLQGVRREPVHRISVTNHPGTLTTSDRQHQWRGHRTGDGT